MPTNTGFKYDGSRWTCRVDLDVENGLTAVERLPQAGEATIGITPPPGGSVTVRFAVIGTFYPALGLGADGVVSAPILETIPSTITAIEVVASAPGAVVEIAQ